MIAPEINCPTVAISNAGATQENRILFTEPRALFVKLHLTDVAESSGDSGIWVAITIILLHVTGGKEGGCITTLGRFRAIAAKSSRILSIGYGSLFAAAISTGLHIVDLNPLGIRALGPPAELASLLTNFFQFPVRLSPFSHSLALSLFYSGWETRLLPGIYADYSERTQVSDNRNPFVLIEGRCHGKISGTSILAIGAAQK